MGDIRGFHYPDDSFALVRQMFRVKPRKASQHSYQIFDQATTIQDESYLLETPGTPEYEYASNYFQRGEPVPRAKVNWAHASFDDNPTYTLHPPGR